MTDFQIILRDYVLLGTEFLAAFTGLIFLLKSKNSYWNWFSLYLMIIFIQEFFWRNNPNIDKAYLFQYYVFLGIPIQYIFFYWLYAYKSFKNKNLFLIICSSYIITLTLFGYFRDIVEMFFLSTNIGSLFLIWLLILEFVKQIKSNDILKFKENRMFYINLGLILFYIGSYPFHVFGKELSEVDPLIWSYYFSYTLIANCLMYLIFTASFIWGKTH